METLEILALCFASFAVGFNLCNVIWLFFSPRNKRDNRNDNASNADE